MADQLMPSPRVSEADWYTAGLNGFGARVDQVVPHGYPAYARILHPARDERGSEVRWSDVAAWSGKVLHPLAQFHRIAGRWEYEPSNPVGWPGDNPDEGSLPSQQLRVLYEMLAGHTSTPDRCWLTVWDGNGNVPEDWRRTAPRVNQPERNYYIFERPLAEVLEFSVMIDRIGWDQDPLPPSMCRLEAIGPSTDQELPDQAEQHPNELVSIQSPNQWWPQDHAWCVASEIDLDSTVVAGSDDLIGEITAHPDLEAFAVGSTDDLTYDGDKINS
ncbi:MAG TPA: hypothetical protein VKB55_10710 [Nocardioidaceae bacterium]|nr:hypothetical protein [Nocardioidaceae bacterium]